MRCPKCQSQNLEETGETDADNIEDLIKCRKCGYTDVESMFEEEKTMTEEKKTNTQLIAEMTDREKEAICQYLRGEVYDMVGQMHNDIISFKVSAYDAAINDTREQLLAWKARVDALETAIKYLNKLEEKYGNKIYEAKKE